MLIRYTWPALVWSFIILVVTLIPGKTLPKVGFFQIDKVVHFFIFGTLMLLSSYALKKTCDYTGRPAKVLLITTLYSTAFGIMIEFLQQFVPGRGPSIADVVANTIGVGLGYLAFRFFEKRNWV
ncbi:VanZ family protein [Ohtaekwangia koreensis]|uniref:VanZ like family protein n=1 Tax=Ohtaekwangia koreensis TaxID=688867 RepID=A0A1T5M295_9BACT|nr:VanZ family protein [Ohtaekwangia koreensis]SKC82372.1 VanZ like family protein [Ohtaekwangia koreensis]